MRRFSSPCPPSRALSAAARSGLSGGSALLTVRLDGWSRSVVSACVIFALVTMGAGSARAYRTAADLPETTSERIRWASDPNIVIGRSLLEVGELEAVSAAVGSAITAWNQVECASIGVRSAGVGGDAAPADGTNTITLLRSWPADQDPAAAATTDVRYLRRGDGEEMVEADIYLNGEHHDWSLAGASGGPRDLQAVLTHELGHVLGLLHPCGDVGAPSCADEHVSSALHPTYSIGQRVPSEDDRAGLCFLYPVAEDSGARCPISCPTDLECGPDGRCEARACERSGDCDSGRCVDSRCQPIAPALGDPCTTDGECGVGSCAPDGICRSECPAGECSEGSHRCEGGLCRPVAGGDYGEPCDDGSDCASGWCWSRGRESGCTRACMGACPAGDRCTLVDARAVCAPRSSQGGCSTATSARTRGSWWFVIALGLCRWRSRRRRGGPSV